MKFKSLTLVTIFALASLVCRRRDRRRQGRQSHRQGNSKGDQENSKGDRENSKGHCPWH